MVMLSLNRALSAISLTLVLLFCFNVVGTFARGRSWRTRFAPAADKFRGYGGYTGRRFSFLPSYNVRYYQDPAENYLELLEEELEDAGDNDVCKNKACIANEDCCAGDVCVDFTGVIGKCVSGGGKNKKERCGSDEDCQPGLLCDVDGDGDKTCVNEGRGKKHLNEACDMSSECDVSHGLCCQLQRRIRQRARKACLYFKDPMTCIGPVDPNDVKFAVPDLPNEKRIFF